MDTRPTKLRLSYHDCYTVYRALEDLLCKTVDPDDASDIQQLIHRVSAAVRDEPDTEPVKN